MSVITLGTGDVKLTILGRKKLFVKVANSDLWILRKIDLLAKQPFMRFLKVKDPDECMDFATRHEAQLYSGDNAREKSFALLNSLIRWGVGGQSLGIVIHKAVVARIIQTMSQEQAKDLINTLASKQPAGPIMNGFLSNEHGRLYLTGKDESGNNLGWGWRLERTPEKWRTVEVYPQVKHKKIGGEYLVTRYLSRRVRPITEENIHLSVFGSMVTPVDEFHDSLLKDFGSFADPYSAEHRRLAKGVEGDCVDIPLIRKGSQLTLQQQFSNKPQEES